MRKFILTIVLLVGLIAGCVFYLNLGNNVRVENSPEYQETYYTVVEGKLKHQLTVYGTEINRDVLSYSSNAVGIKAQLKPLKAILTKLSAKEGKLRPTFYWQTTKGYPEFFARLSDAAQQYPAWQRRSGQGEEALLLVKIANENQVYPELTELFSALGYTIRVASVEKVIIDQPTGKPLDFMLWFRIEKTAAAP